MFADMQLLPGREYRNQDGMWRRFRYLTKSLSQSNKDRPVFSGLFSNLLSESDNVTAQAYLDLQESINELSAGQQSHPRHSYPFLSSIVSKNINELEMKELEVLAREYYIGNKEFNIPQNSEKAVELWTKASKLGSVEGKYSLAACKREGVGTAKDSNDAFNIFNDLADNHDYPLAHYGLGVMYDNGEGTAVDLKKAFKHHKAAARGGILESIRIIGDYYATGQGVEKNDEEAVRHYEIASLAGDALAQFTLGNRYYRGIGVRKDRQKAFELQLQAAKSGFPMAMFNVGNHFFTGEGVARDFRQAAGWFEKASVPGNIPEAGVNLANMYLQGIGVEKSVEKAVSILEKQAPSHEVSRQLLREIQVNYS